MFSFGIRSNTGPAEGETKMRITFLTIMVAISSVFGVQQAFAKTPSTTEVMFKKHKKKHMKQIATSFRHTGARLAV
jgi:hypothetical protein